jgi:tetratricopeptide (TPR) repeat protein
MMTFESDQTVSSSIVSWRRRARWFALPLVVVLLAACGASKANAPTVDPLTAGLKAQTEGRTADAVKDYQAVLQKDPHNKYAYYNLGLIDQLAGRADSAELNYRTTLQSDPNFAPALYNLAILRTGPSPNEAVDLYRHEITIMPGDAAAHLNLGFLLISLKQPVEGKAELDRAVALDPSMAARVQATLASVTSATTVTTAKKK